MKLRELDSNGNVQGYVLVKSCERKTTKNGAIYLDLSVCDGEKDYSAKMWDYKGEVNSQPVPSTVILVRGLLSTYNNQPQLRIDRFRVLDDRDSVEISDFVPSAPFDGEEMFNEILAIVEGFTDNSIKKLTSAVLNEYKDKILNLPAAFRLHHAVRSGLLMHTLTICRMAQAVGKIYPAVDTDLLLSGAILHDIAKAEEFNVAPTGLVEEYTVRGTLIGHLVGGAMIIDSIGKKIGIDENTLMLVEHMIISHHGKPEYGVAVRPLLLEAQILAALDTLDADIYEIVNAVKDVPTDSFTNRMWALDDRKFYNHGRKELTTSTDIISK